MVRSGEALSKNSYQRRRIEKIRAHVSYGRERIKTQTCEKKMQFDEAIKINDLGAIIDAQYGQWGHFNQAAADVIWKASSSETAPYFRITLASMLAVTMMNESTFRLYVTPNINDSKIPENIHNPSAWDFGPCQINFFWNVLETWEGNLIMRGLPWRTVFGSPPFKPDQPFNGDPVNNTRACARIMLNKKPGLDAVGTAESAQETQVVHFTGGDDPERMDHRRADWRKYGKLFQEFYQAYV